MALSIHRNDTYVYNFNGTNFTHFQTISGLASLDHWRYPSLSQDNLYLAVTGIGDNFVKIYKNNGPSFSELPNNGTLSFLSGEPRFASFSSDNTYFVLSFSNGSTHIYTGLQNDNLILQSTVIGLYHHALTPDNQYLVTGSDTFATVYTNTDFPQCQIAYCLECDGSGCIHCNQMIDYFLNSSSKQC